MIALGDTHCGHKAGLTPPKYQKNEHQEIYWKAFDRMLKEFRCGKKIDVALWNGDLVDGSGERSGGTEEDSTDANRQTEIARAVVGHVGAKENIFTYGTPYHAGNKDCDFEVQIARDFGGNISGQQFFSVNKTMFHAKHKVGGSQAGVHTRFTAIARQKMWNMFWAEHDECPKAQVFIRSHVHYHVYCGDDKWLAMVLPALQGWGSKYGERQCEGTVHFGFVGFWVGDNGGLPAWRAYVCREARRASIARF